MLEDACFDIELKLAIHLHLADELPIVVAFAVTSSFSVNHQQIESEEESLLRYGQFNWQGESLGSIAIIWLTHILSQADHCLNHLQGWVAKRLETLKTFVGEKLEELDLTDNR